MVYIILALLYCVSCFSLIKIGKYLQIRKPYLALLPLINMIYLCAIADKLDSETFYNKHVKYSHICTMLMTMCVVSGIFRFNVLFILSVIALIHVLILSYFVLLDMSMRFPMVCLFATLLIPFPIFLLIASFNLPDSVEEVLQLYY